MSTLAFEPIDESASQPALHTADDASQLQLLSERLLPRRELQIELVETTGNRPAVEVSRWIVFDPISRQSYRIGWLEHWLLSRIDGRKTTQQLLLRFRQQHSEVHITDRQLISLVHQLVTSGLIQRRSITTRSKEGGLQEFAAGMVVWQIRGLQPDAWLGKLLPQTQWLFSARAVAFWLGAGLFTVAAVLLDFQRLSAQSLSWQWLLRPETGGMLFVVFLITRALHELGHALVCKRFGARCPDVGVFLILGAPCVYCDVSESWRLGNRWQRAAVASAGMYVELIVATLAAWLWLLTVDGPSNTLALQTMIVCSISTVIINANPLMRFDGYYILADWLDEANLRSKADALAMQSLQRWVLGSSANELTAVRTRSERRRARWLAIFSLAGWGYRALLSITIATVLVSIYAGWNLVWVGRGLAALVMLSWWGIPSMQLVQTLWRKADSPSSKVRLGLFAAALVICIGFVPLPNRRIASGWIQPAVSRGVFASSEGRLKSFSAKDGEVVEAERSVLFELESPELELEKLELKGRRDIAKTQLTTAELIGTSISGAGDEDSPKARAVAAEESLAEAEARLAKLKIRAPMSGMFSAAIPASEDNSVNPPANWCSDEHLGRAVQPDTLLGVICSPNCMAVIPLEESQLRDVASGTEVRLRIPDSSGRVAKTQVKSIVQLQELGSLWQQHNHRRLPESATTQQTTGNASVHPNAVQFAAVVDLPEQLHGVPGTQLDAVFVAPSATLASFASSWAKANLRFLAD